MIVPRITCCKECTDIVPLIQEIDCRLSELSNSAYNNIVYALNNSMDQTEPISLLFYKRILQYKIINPDYAGAFSPEMIASQIKKYTVGCDKNCYCEELMDSFGTTTSTSTSTTTTIAPTTTTTTTAIPITTTTTTLTTIISYSYTIGVYDCYCELLEFVTLFNATPLTENKFYFNFTIIKVISFNGIVSSAPAASILDSTKKDTCAEVLGCPTTTSTSSSSTTSTSSTSTSSTSSTSTSSTSTSSTSTTTTSSTSTTTTSTTANPFPFNFTLSLPASTAPTACSNIPNATFVKSNCSAIGISVGCEIRTLFTNLLFNGGDQWYQTDLGFNPIKIGGPGANLGKVIEIAFC